MQPTRYSTCFYGHDGWAIPARHAPSLDDYADIDFLFKQPRSGSGNGYVGSPGVQALAVLDAPLRTFGMTELLSAHADSYDDVISGEYGEAAESGAVIARRNERERNRVKTINQTFARLRQHLPLSAATAAVKSTGTQNGMKSKKLSKVQILRAATHYIGQLRQLLMTEDGVAGLPSDAEYARTSRTQCVSISSRDGSYISARVEEQPRHEQRDGSSSTRNRCKTMLLFHQNHHHLPRLLALNSYSCLLYYFTICAIYFST